MCHFLHFIRIGIGIVIGVGSVSVNRPLIVCGSEESQGPLMVRMAPKPLLDQHTFQAAVGAKPDSCLFY